MNLPAYPANLRKQIKGANYPAPHHIMSASVEGAQVDFDSAIEIEGRYFVDLVVGQVSKNMIQAFFFDLQAVSGDRDRPSDIPPFASKKVVVLGAGMMGAGIAYQCAKSGIDVVLKDVDQAAAERGKGYSEGLVAKGVERGKVTQEKGDALLARIKPSVDPADADGADLVIEAVFEDPGVKAQVFAEIEPHLADDALLCSNTSTLPITELAEGVSRPDDFIGLHFFSPVDKMPLVEIIKGEKTSDETVLPRARRGQADQEDPDRGQRLARLLHLARDRHVHQRGDRHAHRGRSGAVDRAGVVAGGLPRAGAAALGRAEPEAHAQDPRGGRGRRRDGGSGWERPPVDRGDRPDARRVRPARQARGQGLLLLRGRASAPASGTA